jgi:hypothetical protein
MWIPSRQGKQRVGIARKNPGLAGYCRGSFHFVRMALDGTKATGRALGYSSGVSAGAAHGEYFKKKKGKSIIDAAPPLAG